MVVGDAHMFPGFLTPVLTQLFFLKPPTTFLTCFCRGERRKYAGKKSCLNRGSNSQPPGHESDTLTTEPTGRGSMLMSQTTKDLQNNNFNKFSFKKTQQDTLWEKEKILKQSGKKRKCWLLKIFIFIGSIN